MTEKLYFVLLGITAILDSFNPAGIQLLCSQ